MESPIVLCQNRLLRRGGSCRALLLATTAMTSSLMIGQALAQSLPTGGSVAAGSVSITAPSSTQLNITQTSPSAVVNWQGFSIGQGSAVNIQQPNVNSALLNRVTGDAPSTIAGSLTANGQIYLVNPNGIAITTSGVVNTGGGFVASTLGISDADFQSGKRIFTGSGASAGVSNGGTITVGRGGYAALIGGAVSNTGSIVVPFGKVGLGSGERATLDFSGDGFLQVALPTDASGTGVLIEQSGRIKADGGSVVISAATAREAARNAINISGLVQARSISGHNGSIVIGGGAGGAVKVSGKLNVTSRKAKGGAIAVTGRDIVLEGASVDASGKAGGGSVNIGGGRQGEGPLQRADIVTVDKNTTIRADAQAIGNGGDVVLWSDSLTRYYGTITARGGVLGGNGGEAEVSGKAKLDYAGFTDLSAANGWFGTLLLDPFNVTISTGANTGDSFIANADDSIINVTTLQTALGAANVTVTTGTGGSQDGNITVAAPLGWAAPTTLTLNAAGAIAINAPISIAGAGGLALTASAVAGITTTGLTFGGGASVNYGATDNGGNFSLNGRAYTLVYTMAQLDAIDGVNAVDGAGLVTYGDGLRGSYALANDLTASETGYTRALIGVGNATPFRGILDGLGHTITGLTISAPATNYVALIGHKVTGSVSNIGLVDGSISGQDQVGVLIGFNDSGVVQTSYNTGTVSGNHQVGGLVGVSYVAAVQSSYSTGAVTGASRTGGLVGETNFGSSLRNTYATGTVTSTGDDTGGLVGSNSGGTLDSSYATGTVAGAGNTGGLAGYNNQIIRNSYATGIVTGTNSTGGLLGRNEGTVDRSYATGVTTGNENTGGLVGYNNRIVQNSYATGAVNGDTRTGGLIGQNNFGDVLVLDSYASGAVTGIGVNTGGLIGDHSRGTVDGSYASGAVSGSQNVGGLVGYSTQMIQNSHATGNVTGTDSTGGLLGTNEGTVDGSYATGMTTGEAITGGLVGFARGDAIVRNSYATGAVSGFEHTGGLIGTANFGNPAILNSYATGVVRGTGSQTGGLIGSAGAGSIDNSYATGAVSGGDYYTGGLIGYGFVTIQRSYATGAVSGGFSVGGLAGYNDGKIASSYAMGAVSGQAFVGGLVGDNGYDGTVETSYVIGAVTGGSPVGGLIGNNDGSVASSYWDISTSGRSIGIGAGENMSGATGLTTAQLQGAATVSLGAAFSGGAAGGAAGLYPFLLSIFPDGVTAISGFAYKDAGVTPAASGASGAVQVGLTVGGVAQAPVTTGANGYYYFAIPSGSIAGTGTMVVATTAADASTGAQDGAAARAATGSVSGLDIFGGSSHFLTTALTYSASGYGSVLDSASTPAFVAALPTTITATGASFTMDQPLTVSGSLAVRTTATDAGLVVGAPITLAGASTLTLTAAGALMIDAPISVTGAGSVVLAAAAQNGITTSGLIFGNGASIDYGATDDGGAFSLNGDNYTLVYSMAQLDAIDGRNAVDGTALAVYGDGVTGNYALAHNLAAAGTTYTRSVVGDFPTFDLANAFSGRLDGLGHTVTDLTIDAPTTDRVGLIGYLAGGTVSNIGVVGGSVIGRSNVGALVGILSGTEATLQTSYATATVASAGSGNSTGGLAGGNNGTVQSSHATGAVAGGHYVGGLVGYNLRTINTSYATGSVTGTTNTGGLVGLNSAGTIADSYSTGAVRGGDQAGGLLGTNSGGVVQTSYATGMVSATTNVGGLIGSNYGTVASSYWNSETSGQSIGMGSDSRSQSANVTSRTTAQLQDGSLPAGFGAAWSSGAGLYPYLTWQFAAGTTPQSVSGIAYNADGTALAGALVAGTINGAAFAGGNVSTGANGYYYVVMPQGAIAAGNDVFTYVAGDTVKANSFLQGATGSVQNLDLHGGMLTVTTGATTLSSVAAGLASAVGATATADLSFTTPGGVLTPKAATGVSIAASGDFGIDQALVAANDVLINAAGSLTIASTGTVTSSGGDATLVAGTTFANARGSDALSAASGRWLVYSDDPADDTRGGLIYDFKQYAATFGVTAVAQTTGNGVLYAVAPVAGLTASFSKTYDGDNSAALSSSATGIDGDVLILNASSAVFDNANAGTGKIVTVTGLTVASASNGSVAVYGYTLGSTAASGIGTITPRPITVTADAQTRVYGEANPELTYQVTGNLVNQDSFTGRLATTATTASAAGSYSIEQSTLTAGSNYALTYRGANLIVTAPPAPPEPPTVTDPTPAASTISDMVQYSGTVSPINFPYPPAPAYGSASAPDACCTTLFYEDRRFGR